MTKINELCYIRTADVGVAEQDEILGCYEEDICDDNDEVLEKVVSLYEY